MSSVESERPSRVARTMEVNGWWFAEMSSEVESERLSATESAAPGSPMPAKKPKLSLPEHSPPCGLLGNARGITGDALAAYMAKHWPAEWF